MRSNYRTLLVVAIFAIAATAGFLTSLLVHHFRYETEANVPRSYHYPLTFVKHLRHDAKAGEKIYKEFCVSCHAPNAVIPVHAPRYGVKKDWRAYLKLSDKQLLQLAINGLGPMPARGGCFECDDKLLQQAIGYLMTPIK